MIRKKQIQEYKSRWTDVIWVDVSLGKIVGDLFYLILLAKGQAL